MEAIFATIIIILIIVALAYWQYVLPVIMIAVAIFAWLDWKAKEKTRPTTAIPRSHHDPWLDDIEKQNQEEVETREKSRQDELADHQRERQDFLKCKDELELIRKKLDILIAQLLLDIGKLIFSGERSWSKPGVSRSHYDGDKIYSHTWTLFDCKYRDSPSDHAWWIRVSINCTRTGVDKNFNVKAMAPEYAIGDSYYKSVYEGASESLSLDDLKEALRTSVKAILQHMRIPAKMNTDSGRT